MYHKDNAHLLSPFEPSVRIDSSLLTLTKSSQPSIVTQPPAPNELDDSRIFTENPPKTDQGAVTTTIATISLPSVAERRNTARIQQLTTENRQIIGTYIRTEKMDKVHRTL